MEPKQVGPNGGLERTPALERPAYGENGNSSHELGESHSHENEIERRPEVGAVQAEAQQVAMPALPTAIVQDDDSLSVATSDGTTLIAHDDDLIEKEWVDKAKHILAETKDDPYAREREIGKLQAEYIRKRSGREIGAVSDNG
jgi:hypothetical protein